MPACLPRPRRCTAAARAASLVMMGIVFILAGCRSQNPAPTGTVESSGTPVAAEPSAEVPAEQRTVTVYCGRNEEMLAPLLALFQQETGIPLQIQYAGSAQLAATIVEEGARTPADVFFAQDVSTLAFLAGQGLLIPLDAAVTAQVPEAFRDANNLWVGTSARARTLVYNTSLVQAALLPTSVDQLVQSTWSGQIGWSPENASFQSFIAAMILERGRDATLQWLRGVAANNPRAFPSNTPLVEAVGSGEIRVGLTNHYYLYRLRQEHGAAFPVANHYFRNSKSESLINAAGVGILQTTDAPEEAARFVAWLLEDTAQAYFASRTYEFPLRDGVTAEGDLPAIRNLNPPTTSLGALGDLEEAVGVLREAGILL